MKKVICLAFIFVTILNGCAIFCKKETTPLQEVLSKYGYTELVPPSDSMSPGTVVRDTVKGGLHPVCTAKDAFGSDWINSIEISKTVIYDIQKERVQNADIEAHYLNLLKVGVGGEKVESVEVSIRNARTKTISSVAASTKAPSNKCYSTILDQKAVPKNAPVDLVTSVFEADVEYKVVFKKGLGLTAEARIEALKAFQAQLAAQSYDQGSDTIKGEGLVFGVRRDLVSLDHYMKANKN